MSVLTTDDHLSIKDGLIEDTEGFKRVQRLRHYHIEKKLAEQLRSASRGERKKLYTTLYDDLYRLVPQHPQLTRKTSPEERRKLIQSQLVLLKRLLKPNVRYLEVGPGDCAVAFEVAKQVKSVYAVDISTTITRHPKVPDNFELRISDGSSIPVPESSIDVVYSNQLMEHLHPEDAGEQLGHIFKALVPGGCYLCITPNRLNGPHDISQYFDSVATGFHLKEYTITELVKLFRATGFETVYIYAGLKGRYVRLPVQFATLLEACLQRLPVHLRRVLVMNRLVRSVLDTKLVGFKGTKSRVRS